MPLETNLEFVNGVAGCGAISFWFSLSSPYADR